MVLKEIEEKISSAEIVWHCRFHPAKGWHEIGCPHKEWTKEDLLSALIRKKKFEQSGLRNEVLTEK